MVHGNGYQESDRGDMRVFALVLNGCVLSVLLQGTLDQDSKSMHWKASFGLPRSREGHWHCEHVAS